MTFFRTNRILICFLTSLTFYFSCTSESNFKENKPIEITQSRFIHTSFFSKSLNRDWNYTIYLPPSYHNSKSSKFEILYLLHGHGGNENAWMAENDLRNSIDSLITKDQLKEFIIAMPDGGNSWYVNGIEPIEDAFINDFRSEINSNYRIYNEFTHQTIGGMSAGGYGSLRFILKYPDQFQNAAQGNTQDMEATSANLLRKECQGCSEARRPSRPASRIQSSGAIVTSQPWIQLTGGYAR